MEELEMPKKLKTGDIAYAGYPTAHVYDFKRNSKKKLTFGKVKHLLWGDWVKVTDYDYPTSDNADIKTKEQKYVTDKLAEESDMIPVRVRGRSGYMYREDLQDNQLLEIVFVDVAQGDGSLLITPNDKKYVIDAGQTNHMHRYLSWRFRDFKKAKNDFDGLIVTHPDKDHYYGFNKLVDEPALRAKNIWHNGFVEQFKVSKGTQSTKDLLGTSKISNGQRYIHGLVEDDEALKKLLRNKDRWIKKSSGRPKQYPELLNAAVEAVSKSNSRRFPNISMLSTKHGEIVDGKSYLPGFSPKLSNKSGCIIEVIGPVVEPDSQGKNRLRTFSSEPAEKTTGISTSVTKNGHSILFKLTYNNLTIFFGGDLNSPAEMFLLQHYTGLDVYSPGVHTPESIAHAARPVFECDVTKNCHHGSADFTDNFLTALNPVATVISSGDAESHAHPRSDTLGAIGHHGRGERSLIFSTELARSTEELTKREQTPWYQALKLKAEAAASNNREEKTRLNEKARILEEKAATNNVTVYGAINFRSDGERVVMAYMLEKPSDSKRWDVYTMESKNGGKLFYVPVKEAKENEKSRRENANTT